MGSDKFTGERPGWGEDFDYDEARHLTAYTFAAGLAEGKRVLDAGCGEGFGTQTLTAVASAVTGIDYNEGAIAFCRSNWQAKNLSFRQVDLTAPGDFVEVFDVVLNFQVLEHIEDPTPFLEGLKARVADGGRLMLTTPNRSKSFSENPYHVREYTAAELTGLLSKVFSEVEILGVHGNDKVIDFDRGREAAVRRILRLDPLGLRNLLPRGFVTFAFSKLAIIVRRSARARSDSTKISPDDFSVNRDRVEEALDLVALCRP